MITILIMRLTSEQIERISALILENLKKKGLVVLKADEKTVLRKITDVFTADLKAEDELDREVEGILSTHAAELDTGRVDYRKMFSMIKHKLARERGIVI